MDRRDFIKTACGAAAGMAFMGGFPFISRGATERPNIIFILSDDHRYDAFGFMDKPWLKTPNMDRLAAEGVHFTNSFVTTSLCSPSRASFLTGQYAARHGVQNNRTPWQDGNFTYMELLHAAGYHTGFMGKWHMPGKLPDFKAQGKMDRFVTFHGQGRYFDCPLIIDGGEKKQDGYITDVLTDYALDFLDGRKNKPFCLYLSHKAVHHEFIPPSRYRGKLDGMKLHPKEKPMIHPVGDVHKYQYDHFEENQQGYYEALMAVDDSVGRVLGYLDEKGMAENTLIVYAGDNGYYWGEHGLIDKRYAYEEGIRIPHLMRYPRALPDGGKKVDEMVLNIDLAPTVLSAAGLAVPGRVQGKSYLELAEGKDVSWRDSWLYEYYEDYNFPHPPCMALRTRDWKLIRYKKGKQVINCHERWPDEMFNIARDPHEKNDLTKDPAYADKKKELTEEMKRLYKEIS
ncbi:MAG TPA: sulfatase-like hydrolase/transferase [bacterium]|nr:sulfatase-like hydrolase/transferase [bacterium]